MKALSIVSALLFLSLASVAASEWTDGKVTAIARINGAIGPPTNAICCMEYTFESDAQKIVAVRFWYYKAPKLTLKVGDHVRLRRKFGANNNLQVSDDGGHTQMMFLTRTEDRRQNGDAK